MLGRVDFFLEADMGRANPDRRAVFVLGSHRAGTSVLARALIASGVYFGENLYGPRFDNPKGFFEDRIVNQLDDKFLATIQCRWNSLYLPPEISKIAITTYQNRLREDVLNRFATKQLWGLKDPRITRLWKHWLPVLVDAEVEPILVLASRHPFSVASSLAKRDQLPQAHALALWALHQLDALEASLQNQAIVVDYDMMMDDPRRQLLRIANFLGEGNRLNQEEIQLFENEFLSKDLRHTRYQHELVSGDLQMLCLELHAEIVKLALLPGGIETSHRNSLNNLLSTNRTELEKSFEWMLAIDELQAHRPVALSSGIAPEMFETKMFWRAVWSDKSDGYTEERSNTQCYAVGGHRQVIQLTFPQEIEQVTRLRLDIVNALGVVDIHDLRLLDRSGVAIWNWSGDLALMQQRVQVVLLPGFTPEVRCVAVSLDDDPWFELDLSKDVYARIQPDCTLVIELTPYRLLDRLPFILQHVAQQVTSTLQCSNAACPAPGEVKCEPLGLATNLEALKKRLQATLTQRDQKIALQDMQLRNLRKEIIRAEAQLDLLKDVILGSRKGDRQ